MNSKPVRLYFAKRFADRLSKEDSYILKRKKKRKRQTDRHRKRDRDTYRSTETKALIEADKERLRQRQITKTATGRFHLSPKEINCPVL